MRDDQPAESHQTRNQTKSAAAKPAEPSTSTGVAYSVSVLILLSAAIIVVGNTFVVCLQAQSNAAEEADAARSIQDKMPNTDEDDYCQGLEDEERSMFSGKAAASCTCLVVDCVCVLYTRHAPYRCQAHNSDWLSNAPCMPILITMQTPLTLVLN